MLGEFAQKMNENLQDWVGGGGAQTHHENKHGRIFPRKEKEELTKIAPLGTCLA